MLKQFFTALLCGLAVAGQMRAQEVVVAREEKPSASEQAAPVSERTDSESATATRMDTQARKKKSASTALTVEQMRMAGALAAERATGVQFADRQIGSRRPGSADDDRVWKAGTSRFSPGKNRSSRRANRRAAIDKPIIAQASNS